MTAVEAVGSAFSETAWVRALCSLYAVAHAGCEEASLTYQRDIGCQQIFTM